MHLDNVPTPISNDEQMIKPEILRSRSRRCFYASRAVEAPRRDCLASGSSTALFRIVTLEASNLARAAVTSGTTSPR
jgi:hypothetical protein